MAMELCHGPHAWEVDKKLCVSGGWYRCLRCHVLGKREDDGIVVVPCVECGEPAVTLWQVELGKPHVPVCENDANGVIL